MATPTCVKCGGRMSEGFIADTTHHSRVICSSWIEGKPVRSFWTGLQTAGRRRFFAVTWRCERCGYLEAYAATT